MESDSSKAVYKRVLIKLSGEALMGPTEYGLHTPTVEAIRDEIIKVKELGVEIALVVGGGNIFRGLNAAERGMDRVTADNMGMLATVINSLALMDALEAKGVFTRVMSAMRIEAFTEPYIRRRAVRHLADRSGRVLAPALRAGARTLPSSRHR